MITISITWRRNQLTGVTELIDSGTGATLFTANAETAAQLGYEPLALAQAIEEMCDSIDLEQESDLYDIDFDPEWQASYSYDPALKDDEIEHFVKDDTQPMPSVYGAVTPQSIAFVGANATVYVACYGNDGIDGGPDEWYVIKREANQLKFNEDSSPAEPDSISAWTTHDAAYMAAVQYGHARRGK